MILPLRLAFTAHATVTAPRHHCCHKVPPNGRLAPPSLPACSCSPPSMAEMFNPAPSLAGAVDYGQRRRQRARRLRLKDSRADGGGDGGGCKGPGSPNRSNVFHPTSAKRSHVVAMSSGLLGDRQQAVHDGDLGLGLGGGRAIRKDVGPGAGGDGEVLQSEAARAYYERKREALRKEEEGRGRDLCDRCRRAQRVSWFKYFT